MQPSFNNNIQKVIKKFSYPMWIIYRDQDIKCTCVDFTTNQPNPKCKKCLGTGRKIKIRKITAARQPFRVSITGQGVATEFSLYSTYYTLNNIKANPRDILIDKNSVDVIQDYYEERCNDNEPTYYRYLTAPKKTNKDIFFKMFNYILGSDKNV